MDPLSSVRTTPTPFGLGSANAYSPFAPNAQSMIDQIIAQVNAQLAAAGIPSPFAGVTPAATAPTAAAPDPRHAAATGQGGFTDGGWMQALERLRGGGGGGSDGDRLMREAARAMRGGGRGASASANGGSITHGDIGPNTTLNLSADAGRATDRTRRRY